MGPVVINGQTTLNAAQEIVWKVLQDPDALKNAIPGCDELTEIEPDTYKATLKLGVAAVRGTYVARVQVADQVAPSQYRLRINGSGGTGFVDVDGTVRLTATGSDTTAVEYEFDVNVGGTIAGVGQRMLSGVAKFMMGEFVKSMEKQIPK